MPVTYARRSARLTKGQKRSLETLSHRYILPYQAEPLDWTQAFHRQAPAIIEIGFGMGELTVQFAEAYPEKNFLAIDVYLPGIAYLLREISARQLSNILIVQADAKAIVQNMLAPNSLAGINIFFPDPWPKRRHHKRRLLQANFLDLLVQKLKPGGLLHCASDWEDYAKSIQCLFQQHPQLIECKDFSRVRPLTKFERRGIALGHNISDLIAIKKTPGL